MCPSSSMSDFGKYHEAIFERQQTILYLNCTAWVLMQMYHCGTSEPQGRTQASLSASLPLFLITPGSPQPLNYLDGTGLFCTCRALTRWSCKVYILFHLALLSAVAILRRSPFPIDYWYIPLQIRYDVFIHSCWWPFLVLTILTGYKYSH